MATARDLPWQKWYWADWFAASDVHMLSREDRCLWFEMIGRMWESAERGFLTVNGRPASDEELSRLFNSDKAWLKGALERLEASGLFSRREDGAIFCRKIVRELAKSDTKSAAGKEGATIRYSRNEVSAIAPANHLPSPIGNGYGNGNSCIPSSSLPLKDSTTLSRDPAPLAPVGEEPRPVPAWVQEHKALERGDTLKQEIDRLIAVRPIYGTRITVTQALGAAKGRGGYDESIALASLPTRASYERRKGMKTPMKLETLLETGGWAVDWEERLSQEVPEVDEDGFTREEIDNAF